jgi:hypothetical protein
MHLVFRRLLLALGTPICSELNVFACPSIYLHCDKTPYDCFASHIFQTKIGSFTHSLVMFDILEHAAIGSITLGNM